MLTYALCGMLAALAVSSPGCCRAAATSGNVYTVYSLTAVALGGTALAGGRGGLFGAAMGGVVLYLIQNLLTAGRQPVPLGIANGVLLIAALAANELLEHWRKKRALRGGTTPAPVVAGAVAAPETGR